MGFSAGHLALTSNEDRQRRAWRDSIAAALFEVVASLELDHRMRSSKIVPAGLSAERNSHYYQRETDKGDQSAGRTACRVQSEKIKGLTLRRALLSDHI
jgi:hypothetical protein